jgi:primosomal protein N' (replication factor Y) (superfamily II helicase)
MIAVVYVDVAHQAVDQGFDYLVPKELINLIEVGQRVEIPFGPRTISGIVIELKETSILKTLKPIKRLLDIKPVFNHEMLHLAETLSYKYTTPRIEYLHAMLPNAMRMTYQKQLILKDKQKLDKTLEVFFDKPIINYDIIPPKCYKILKTMIDEGVIEQRTKVKQKTGIKSEEYVYLNEHNETFKGAKQKAILDYLSHHKMPLKQTLLEDTSSTLSTLNTLIDKKVVTILSKEKYREQETLYELKDKIVTLNEAQFEAVNRITTTFNQPITYLLHGITSSGKTEVYLELTSRMVKTGKSVLIMVPEISLTPALTARFKARFGEQVVVYHSRLTQGEQYDEWRKVIKNEAHIVIGARSAVFSPIKNIGLIIMDEEHSDSYVQTDTPRYHAKEIAHLRSKTHKAPLILGSATPSVESYYYALNGHYELLELKHRALKSILPNITIVDMKEEFINGNKSIFSNTLIDAMEKRLLLNEQTLLLINRRGHANFVLCRSCGKAVECDQCDVSLTYHQYTNNLKCHYCSSEKPMPNTCPSCGSIHIRYMGIGSEKVEETLKKHFKEATIYRMDKDTTTQKQAHEKILHQFEEDGDFLVGTQMISKGLDFERVSLVAILSADMSLFIPDYYAKEDTFNLLTQMAGRSGRREKQGEVIIQAYDSTHPVLKDVQNHDYTNFYQHEINLREHAGMPPFKKLLSITIIHDKYNAAFNKATEYLKVLKRECSASTKIIGPIKPKISKISGKYRVHILLKYLDEPNLMPLINQMARNIDLSKYGFLVDHHPSLL